MKDNVIAVIKFMCLCTDNGVQAILCIVDFALLDKTR